MATTQTYDAAQHLASFLGNALPLATGPDTFLKVSRNQDGYTTQVGASGYGTRSRINDKSGTVELTLMAASQTNDILMAIALSDELAPGSGAGPLFIKEANGTTVVAAQNAWIKKIPDMERGKEAGTVTWVFESDNLEMFIGGLL